MFDRRGKSALSNGKWARVRLAVVVTTTLLVVISIPFPAAALIPSAIRHVQPTADFVFSVIAPNISNWITPSCLYLLLNILILILGIQSGALTHSNSDYAHAHPPTGFIKPQVDADDIAQADVEVEDSHEFGIQTHIHTNSISNMSTISAGCQGNVSKPEETSDSKANVFSDRMRDIKASAGQTQQEKSNMKEVDYLLAKSYGGLYCKKSRCNLLRRSTTGLSNLSRETTHVHTQPSPPLDAVKESVVFEICAEVDEVAEEDDKVRRHEGILSSDELYIKAESFIGNFYRELKMQRENSWKRLCAIYRQSC